MKIFRRLPALILLIALLFSSLRESIFADEISLMHSPEELPSYYMNPNEVKASQETLSVELDEDGASESIISLMADRGTYVATSTETKEPPLRSSLDAPDAMMKDFSLQKPARMRNTVAGMEKNSIETNLQGETLIQEKNKRTINPSAIGIHEISAVNKEKAVKKIMEKMKRGKKGVLFDSGMISPFAFEFGIEGEHLIFSKPVAITVNTPNMSDGIGLDIFVLHAGDTDFNTAGLTSAGDSGCNPDGTATKPGNTAIVRGGKIIFYTCGASSFTMNPSGGTAGSNDLRLIIGDCAQLQIYYNNLTQIYQGNPAATGCGLPALWAMLRIGATTYGNGVDGVTATAWSTQSTTGSTNGNTYTATSTMTRVVGSLTYTLIIDWSYTAPNKYFTWNYRVIVPTGNTENIRFYMANDSAVAGTDTNDVGYYTMNGGQTMGVYDNTTNVLSAFRYLSGPAWTGYEAGVYSTLATRITGGTDFANTIQNTTADFGFGVNWDFGTGANVTYSGSTEWRVLPYVAANVPDLIPGIGQPEGPLTTYLLSQLPITVTNAGNIASSGVHTVVLTVPADITGPTSSFSDNGWSCGAQIGTGVTCTKTTAIAASLGTDTVRIPVTPTLAASGTSVRFDVAISNPGDSNVTNNTAFAINSVVGGAATATPGGVAGGTLWLRANTGTNCTTPGCIITTWTNSGTLGAAANAVTGLGTVTYDPVNALNGNATLFFNNASLNTNNTLSLPTRANSIFVVSRIGTGGQFLMGTQTVTNKARSWTTTPTTDIWMRYTNTVYYSAANRRSPDTPAITSTIRQVAGASTGYTNGQSLLTSGDTSQFTVNNIGIGRIGNTNSTLTNVAEVIIYPTSITLSQQNQVESYLAVKYGITLDQTSATDYILSNASIIWNAASAGVNKNNIAGIGRDDASGLSQLRSQSVTNTGDIIGWKSSIATNRMALMWGHDGAQISAFTGTDAPTGYQRISRIWQFQEKNGDLGTVNISYPASALAGGFVAPLMLLTDADGTFVTGTVAYTGTYSTGTNTWDFSLNIADMHSVSFAKIVSVDTTPPVISNANIASGTLIPKGTFSYSFSYADTGSAINTGSVALGIYSWNTGSSTWNVTDLAGTYATLTSATSSTGTFQITDLPFGKYRFDQIVSDTSANRATQSTTLFVDAITWTISAPLYDIGGGQTNITSFGSGELIITMQTVGAGINLSMIRTQDLIFGSGTITVWNGTDGWGYDLYNGVSYSGSLTAHGTGQTLANIAKNIDQSGQRNTFIYRLKYGVNPNVNILSGDYLGKLQFGLNLTY